MDRERIDRSLILHFIFSDLHDVDVLRLHVHHPLLPARRIQLPDLQENQAVIADQNQRHTVGLG